jgi:hypothetical protein
MSLHLEISTAQIEQVSSSLGATPSLTQKALNSTLGKMATWLKARSIKGLSKALMMQPKIIRRRLKTLRLRKSANGSLASVWYGLDSVSLINLQAKQNKQGVKAYGGRFVKSAFIAKGRNGNKQVFKRVGKSRLPVKKQTDAIQEKADKYLDHNTVNSSAFSAQFFKVFEHELSWRMQTQ